MLAYATSLFSDLAAVVYDFSPSLAGEDARNFLKDRKGKLVFDGFGGYKSSFKLGVTEIGSPMTGQQRLADSRGTTKECTAKPGILGQAHPNWL